MGAQPTVIIIDSDPDGRATTAALLADAPVDLIASAAYGHQASAQVAVVQPHIVLAAIAEPLDDAIATLKAIAQQCPHTSIIAYSQLVGPSVLRHVAQLGVADLLPQPLDPADLQAAIERIPFQQPVQTTGRVITVFGAKGGIGKSTIATSMAVSISQDAAASVLLIDLDTRFGDIAIMMDVEARATISDLARQTGKLTANSLTQSVVTHGSGVQILAAPRHPSEWSTITHEQVQTIVQLARDRYDYVILDTPGTFNDIVATAIEVADQLLVVSSLELTSIKDTAHLLDLLEAEGYPSDRVLLTINDVNRVKAIRTPDVGRVLRHDVFWEIPYDEQILRATQIGQPVVTARPEAVASSELRAMTAHIVGPDSAMASTTTQSHGGSLLASAWSAVAAAPRWAAKRRRGPIAQLPTTQSPGQTTLAPDAKPATRAA